MSQGFAQKSGLGNLAGLVLGDGAGNFEGVDFEAGVFTPTLTFLTPGDQSFSYTIQEGRYLRINDFVIVHCRVAATPTYSSAAGSIRINGFPFTHGGSPPPVLSGQFVTNGVVYPAGRTQVLAVAIAGGSQFGIELTGSSQNRNSADTGQYPSGSARDFRLSGITYIVP